MTWRTTIGLEVHVELKTNTKMFCDSRNDPREGRPNYNICPICMAHPGTLPVINREAVRHVLRLGKAVGGVVADYTEFDRKNYFYPDIPKGYQISQFAYPLISGGSLLTVAITRIHLEEDTARSSHTAEGTLIDFNRAGVPLMELVTEPVIHDAATAGSFARELQLLLRYLKASDANMEEGQMRVEANISVAPEGSDILGTKVEVKNLNSFRSMERAIEYEVARHIALIEKGEKVLQETRGWDEVRQETFGQRKKESSHDYRYFPDPDLPKLILSKVSDLALDGVSMDMPELPAERRARYQALGIRSEDIESFVRDPRLGDFFDLVVRGGEVEAILAANYLTSDIAGLLEAGVMAVQWLESTSNAERFGALIKMLVAKKISSRGAKDILSKMVSDSREPEVIAEAEGLFQQSDSGALETIAAQVIREQVGVVAEYKGGKISAIQFLVGQGMKVSRGSADPAALREAFEKLLKE